MKKTIRVKGTGRASFAPDTVRLDFTMSSKAKEYDEAMELAGRANLALQNAVAAAGFEKDSLKTGAFQVETSYENVEEPPGRFVSRFNGYICRNVVALEIPYGGSLAELAALMQAVADSDANPEMYISFTLANKDAAREALLRAAAGNARESAQVLADAAGRKLGGLRRIRYAWDEPPMISPTRYAPAAQKMTFAKAADALNSPEDIELSETAEFVWRLE